MENKDKNLEGKMEKTLKKWRKIALFLLILVILCLICLLTFHIKGASKQTKQIEKPTIAAVNKEKAKKGDKGFLPLGSVVTLKSTNHKLLIIQRAVQVPKDGELVYYDYGAALYPEGMLEGKVAYFNKEDISEVVFEGYSNKEDKLVVEKLNRLLKQLKE